MMWKLQCCSTTVLNERMRHFRESKHTLIPPTLSSGGQEPQPQDLRPSMGYATRRFHLFCLCVSRTAQALRPTRILMKFYRSIEIRIRGKLTKCGEYTSPDVTDHTHRWTQIRSIQWRNYSPPRGGVPALPSFRGSFLFMRTSVLQ